MSLFGNKSTTNTSTSTSTQNPFQSGQFGNLLDQADQWLNSGGFSNNPNYTGEASAAVGGMMGSLANIISGQPDRNALNQAKAANAQAAQRQFDQNIVPSLQQNMQQAGQAGSSRSGIASGLAASNMAAQVGEKNAAMEQQFQQNQLNRQLDATKALGQGMDLYSKLQSLSDKTSDAGRMLQNLKVYQDLISGNMGGSSTTTSTSTSSSKNGWLSDILGAGATIAAGLG